MAPLFPSFPIMKLSQYLLDFGDNLEVRHHTAMLRYLTFTALDIPHTCCEPYYRRGSSKRSRQEAAEVEDEHAYELALLEELLREFEGEIVTAFQDPRQKIGGLVFFWERIWLSRMQGVLLRLKGSDLGMDERRGAEEIGVVWDRHQPPKEPDNPYERHTLDHWMLELEKIEAECQ